MEPKKKDSVISDLRAFQLSQNLWGWKKLRLSDPDKYDRTFTKHLWKLRQLQDRAYQHT